MLRIVRTFKSLLVDAIIAKTTDIETERALAEWLVENRYQILDILDDALTEGKK